MTPGAKRGGGVRWLVAGPLVTERLLARRDALGLGGSVRFLSAECDWARAGLSEADLAGLHRLADAVLLAGAEAASGLAALEGALARNLLVLESTPALRELVKGERGVVLLGPRAGGAAAAKRVLAALARAPAAALRRRVRRDLSWAALARDFLVPLVEGKKIGAGTKRL